MPDSRTLTEPLREAPHSLELVGGDPLGVLVATHVLAAEQPPLEHRPDVVGVVALPLLIPPGSDLAKQPERLRERGARGRGEGAEQGLVVERVGDRREQRPQVLDLLLGP